MVLGGAGQVPEDEGHQIRHNSTVLQEALDFEENNKQIMERASFKQKIWIILSEPAVCKEAEWVLHIINFFILISFFSITIATLPTFQTSFWKSFFFYLNTFLIAIFVLDFGLRLATAPDISEFLKDGMTWIDFVSTFSYFPALIWPESRVLGFLRVMRTLRHIRWFRPRRSFIILTTLTSSLRQATSALIAPMYFMMLVLILLGAMCYFCENGHVVEEWQSNTVESIPAGLWWGIVTMSGVGYGEKSPNSTPGKLVAALTAFVGVFFIAMPFAVSGGSFWMALKAYRQQEEPTYEELVAEDVNFNEEEYFGFQKARTIKLMKTMYAWMDVIANLGKEFEDASAETREHAIQQLVDKIQDVHKLQEEFENELIANMDQILEENVVYDTPSL